MCQLLSNYLTKKSKNKESVQHIVNILGPILFNIYVNDIALAAGDSHVHLYADDTIIYTFSSSLTSALSSLQASFTRIQHAFSSLRLVLNTNKTKCMLFNRNLLYVENLPKIISSDGSEIICVECYKYLCIWLDSKLSFETHINVLLRKVKSRIGFYIVINLLSHTLQNSFWLK